MQYYYGAEISALTINDNTLQATVRPGNKVGDACELALSPATSLLTVQNRTETVGRGWEAQDHLVPAAEPERDLRVRPVAPRNQRVYRGCHLPQSRAVLCLLFRRGPGAPGNEGERRNADGELARPASAPVDCDRLVELGSVESPPLRDLAREVQKPSQNLYTDLLLAHVGESARCRPTART